ncbi:MAG: Wzz/FepE/Etk N-terminal domain-containing protein [Acidobacteriota bacterium]
MMEEKPIPWRELIETIFRQRGLILKSTALGVLGALMLALLMPKEYKARARILLTAQALSGPRQAAMTDRQVNAEISLLTSRALTRSVLEDYLKTGRSLEPVTAPISLAKRTVKNSIKALLPERESSEAVEIDPIEARLSGRLLQGTLEARAITATNVIQLSYTGHTPEWGAGFLNDLLKAHVARIAQLNENTAAGTFFHEQRNLLAVRWQEAREAFSQFQNEQDASLLAGDETYLREVLSHFESSFAEAETERLELLAMVKFLKSEIQLLPEKITSESLVTENEGVKYLSARILELEIERSELIARYKPSSARIRSLDQQIAEGKRLLENKETETLAQVTTIVNPARQQLELQLVETETQLRGTTAKVQALTAQIQDYRDKLKWLEGLGTEMERLQDDVKNAKEAYQVYSQKEEEARFSSSLDESGIVNVSIIEAAEIPKRAQPSKARMFVILGLLAGMMLGFVLAFLRDWLDPSIKSSAQAYRLSGIPIIAEIPTR